MTRSVYWKLYTTHLLLYGWSFIDSGGGMRQTPIQIVVSKMDFAFNDPTLSIELSTLFGLRKKSDQNVKTGYVVVFKTTQYASC